MRKQDVWLKMSTMTWPVPPDSCYVDSDEEKEPFNQEALTSSKIPTSKET